MTSIYNGNICDTTDKISKFEFELNSCGESVLYPGKRFVNIRERGRKDYHILYISEGECIAEFDGKEYTIEKNGFVIYYPGQKQKYTYCSPQKTVSFWIHFSGTRVSEIMRECLLESGVYISKSPAQTVKCAETLVREYRNANNLSAIKCTGLLICFITELSRSLKPAIDAQIQISALKDYIHTHYNEKIDIEIFAKNSGVSTDRFLHLFKKYTGQPFHKYHNDVRMCECMRILKNTDLTVKEAAYLCGFSDPLYFSRFFKKHTGISPYEYAKRNGNG